MTPDIGTVLDGLILIAIVAAVLVIRHFLSSYLKKKGENQATKEDIGEITRQIETIRAEHAADLERIRSELQDQAAVLARRREMYDEAVKAMEILVSGRVAGDAEKQRFLTTYARMWLWGSDGVLNGMNALLDLNLQLVRQPGSVSQDQLRSAYATCVLEMRKDSGFPDTRATGESYRFVRF